MAHLGKVMVAQAALGFESLSLRQLLTMFMRKVLMEKLGLVGFGVWVLGAGYLGLAFAGAGIRLSLWAWDSLLNVMTWPLQALGL